MQNLNDGGFAPGAYTPARSSLQISVDSGDGQNGAVVNSGDGAKSLVLSEGHNGPSRTVKEPTPCANGNGDGDGGGLSENMDRDRESTMRGSMESRPSSVKAVVIAEQIMRKIKDKTDDKNFFPPAKYKPSPYFMMTFLICESRQQQHVMRVVSMRLHICCCLQCCRVHTCIHQFRRIRFQCHVFPACICLCVYICFSGCKYACCLHIYVYVHVVQYALCFSVYACVCTYIPTHTHTNIHT
jgi:hypothetical protein